MKASRMSRFHALHPGITSRVFASGKDESGRSSYQLLADLAASTDRVLDLGCGDGHLLQLLSSRAATAIGLDRSPAELALARRRGAIAVPGDATATTPLPFPDAAFSLAVSHLAFSLMEPVERVVSELARVLTPTARFASIVGGGPVATGTSEPNSFDHFLTLLGPALGSIERCRFGDPRAGRPDGWTALFAPHGFHLQQWSRHVIDLSGPLDDVWRLLSTTYDAALLPAPALDALASTFTAWCRERFSPTFVPLQLVVYLAIAARP